jgi:thioredoxin 1
LSAGKKNKNHDESDIIVDLALRCDYPFEDQKGATMPTVTITKDNFNDIVEQSNILILDFWAEWCGPCKNFAPIFEAASEKHDDVVFGKIDTESEQELASVFQIRSIPTLMAFKESVGIFRQAGALPPPAFEDLITQIKDVDMDDVRAQIAEAQKKMEAEEAAKLEGGDSEGTVDF